MPQESVRENLHRIQQEINETKYDGPTSCNRRTDRGAR